MSEEKRNVVRHVIEKSLSVPYQEGDPEREELIQKIIDSTREVTKTELEMVPLKSQKKNAEDIISNACALLVNGKFEEVKVEQVYDYDDGHVTETRLDTNEVIIQREMTEEDHDTDLFDQPEEADNE